MIIPENYLTSVVLADVRNECKIGPNAKEADGRCNDVQWLIVHAKW